MPEPQYNFSGLTKKQSDEPNDKQPQFNFEGLQKVDSTDQQAQLQQPDQEKPGFISEFVDQMGTSLQRGLLRQLPEQIGSAVDFADRLSTKINPVTNLLNQIPPLRDARQWMRDEAGFGGQGIVDAFNQIPAPEAQPQLQQINGIEDLGDPRKLANVIGEQGPAMLANVAATIANPALGMAFISAMEGGEALQQFDQTNNMSEEEKLLLASGVGALNAALEKLGIDTVLGRVPGLKSRLARLIISPLSESSTESLQGMNQILAQNIDEGEPVLQLTEEDIQSLKQQAFGGFVLGFLGGGSSALFDGGETTQKPQKSAKSPTAIDDLDFTDDLNALTPEFDTEGRELTKYGAQDVTDRVQDLERQIQERDTEAARVNQSPQGAEELRKRLAKEEQISKAQAAQQEEAKTRRESPQTVRAWLKRSGIRLKTDQVKQYGFGEGTTENRNLILQIASEKGMGVDEVAEQAIAEGIIPEPPAEYNPADWFMEQVRNNTLTTEADIQQKLDDEAAKMADDKTQIVESDKTIRDAETLKTRFMEAFDMTEDKADAVSQVYDAVAEAWAKDKGVSKDEWYKQRIGDVKRSTRVEDDEVLFQEAQKQMKTPEFKRWFGKSKVVDDNGEPLVVYHGTDQDFDNFKKDKIGQRFPYSFGFHFTNNTNEASLYSDSFENSATNFDPKNKFSKPAKKGANIVPVFLKIENPLIIKTDKLSASMEADLNRYDIISKIVKSRKTDKPYDGVIIESKNGNNVIAFEPNQIKSATGNRGTFDPDNPNILFQAEQNAPVFYSKLGKVIDEKMGGAANPQQLMNMLKKAGVKDEEIEYSGLAQFVDGKNKVSKADVQAWLEENSVQVDEVVKGDKVIDFEPVTDTKYSDWQLPGGKNYRELLLTLPVKKPEKSKERVEYEDWARNLGLSPWGKDAIRLWETLKETPVPKDLSVNETVDAATAGYRSSHFKEPNILAHVRFNERTNADGGKVLFVEEIQSDWHQEGRKKGYKSTKKPLKFDDSKVYETEYQWQYKFDNGRIIGVGKGIISEKLEATKYLKNYTDTLNKEFDNDQINKVPDAPFKTTWNELAFKRMMRWAAENGFDAIAWTTGEQQAERYDLSKQVDEIRYRKSGENQYEIAANKNGQTLMKKSNLSINEVEETLGKEIAEKIQNGVADEKGKVYSFLREDNLKVGGEGMKAFYDKMLVSTANKLGKKYGARVVSVTLNNQQQFSLPVTDKMRFDLMNEGLPLFQRAKGAVEFNQQGQAIIHAFKNADISTALHELAHIFRRDLDAADQQTVLDWAGAEAFTVEVEEKFARAFERYLYEGKAPNEKLKVVFEKLKTWLREIYTQITGSDIDVDITPEIRAVFDKALGVEAETRQETAQPEKTQPTKKRVPGERSFPKTLEDAGMEGGTDRFYDVYSDEKASKQAQDRIVADEAAAYLYAKDETKELSKEQVTTGVYLMQKMQNDMENAATESEKQAIADKQIDLANSLSRRLTQAGQSIQAASIVSKLSPESLLLYATRKVNGINKKNGKKQVRITPDDVQKINTLSKRATTSTDLESAAKEAADILKNYSNGKPVQNGDVEKLTRLSEQIDNALGKDSPKKSRRQSITDSIDKTLSEAEKKAKERLRKRGYNLNVGINPQDLADITIIGAAKIGRTGVKFLKWSNAMVEDFGEDIRPHLKRVFGKSVDLYKSESKKVQNSRRLQREINGVLRKMEANTEVTPEQLDTVSELVDKVRNYSEDAKTEALYELQDFLNSFEKPGIGRKLATGQVLAQLLNPKTIIRNIVGNEIFYRVERLNKYIASPIDWAKSVLTGSERTVTFRTGKQSGFWEGFMKGAKAGWQGHNIYNLETQFDLKGSTFRSKHNPLHWLEKALGVALRGFDTAAYNRAYNQFLGEQAELNIINQKLKFDSKEARQKYIENYISQVDINIEMMAHEEGKYITFQDENTLSRTFTGLKRLLNLNKDFGVGDFILKYPKTPANLLHRALEYSPAGFARSLSILTRPYLNPDVKNRDIVMAVSRAITGTFGFTGLGAILYSMGAISGEEDKDRKVTQFKAEQTGERNYQVNISAINRFVSGGFKPNLLRKRNGDYLVSYDWAQPVAISIAAGANMAKAITEGKTFLKGGGDVAYESLNAAMNTLVEQPLLRGVQDALGSKYDRDILRKFTNILTQVPSSFVPTLFSQIRQFTDNNRRISYDPNPLQKALNRAIYKMPFVSGTLPKTFKTLGINQYAEAYKDGSNTLFNVFFNPAFVSKYSIDPEIALLLEPYEKEGRKSQIPKTAPYTIRAAKRTLARYGLIINEPNHSFKLNAEDIAEFQRQMAEQVTTSIRVLNIDNVKNKPFEDQEKLLGDLVTTSYEKTKEWFFRNKAKTYLRKE